METLFFSLVALSVPAAFFAAATSVDPRQPLRAVRLASFGALFSAPVFAIGVPFVPRAGEFAVRIDPVSATLLLLVSGLAVVITRFSSTYLAGEGGLPRYARWLSIALGCVGLLVITGDLAVLAVAWTGTSVALHQLLTFYPDRRAALVAAHKKFILSRIADVFVWSAIALVGFSVGGTGLDALEAHLAAAGVAELRLQLAALLFVVAVVMKTAQLPFHGWITQVMEAPTPVSALLHAGVVNVGGLVLLRLAPLLAKVPSAQVLLIAFGLTSAVVGALVMTTRVSIKVALAWSTIAQLGFMLVQCGLGAWHLALLHLVAHSLYKAHAFLGAGSAVERWRLRAITPEVTPTGAGLVRAGALSVLVSGLSFGAFAAAGGVSPTVDSIALAVLLALALPTLLTRPSARTVSTAFVAAIAFFGWHAVAEHLVPHAAPVAWLWGVVVVGFGSLFGAQTTLQLRPQGRLARTIHPWLFAGLWLDEGFTRLTFRLWPPRLVNDRRPLATSSISSVEA